LIPQFNLQKRLSFPLSQRSRFSGEFVRRIKIQEKGSLVNRARRYDDFLVARTTPAHLSLIASKENQPIPGGRMRFYTAQECEDWLRDRQRQKPDSDPLAPFERIQFPEESYRYFFFADWIAKSLTFRMPALLWITESGIWGGSENWHLYYKLRQSYGDRQLLDEAPGHLFLEYESDDLASFLQVAMLNGWDGYLLTQADYVNLFLSHDEYIDFFAEKAYLEEIGEGLGIERPAGEKADCGLAVVQADCDPTPGQAGQGIAGAQVDREPADEQGNGGH